MRTLCLTLLLLAGAVSGAQQDATKPTNAVKRVINLLTEMKTQLENEAETDQELYDKLVCWCETNNKEKTLAVANEEQAIIDLGHAINENVAKEATRTSEVSALKAGIAENKETLAKSEEMRAKEEDAFYASEKQATMSITATKNAIKMLEKHNSLSQTSLIELKKHSDRDARTVELFHKVAKGMVRHHSFLQQAPSGGSYAPQSGAIFGILQQMAETFEMNSAQAKKDEVEAVEEYTNLKKSKTAEIAASEQKVTTKTEEAATAKEIAANSRVALADNREALAADTEFLANLKVTCDNLDREWAARSKTRADETAAVAETIAILTDDDNAELMGKSLSFVQLPTKGSIEAQAREVSRLLRTSRNPRAARKETGLLQSRKQGSKAARAEAELNPAFAKVKDSVAGMKTDLKDQKQEEVKTNDDCIAEVRKLNVDITASTNEKEDAETAVADLTQAIAALDDEVKELKKQIGETQVEMKKASQDRELENKEFQSVVADQRATQAVLKKAVDRLAKFYESKAALIQESAKTVRVQHHPDSGAMRIVEGFLQEAKQTPPGGGFQPYAKKGGAGGVMGMIEDLITDSKELETEAVQAEKEAQANYETMIADSNASVEADTKEIANKEAEKGKKDGEKTEAQGSADSSLKDLMSLGELGQLIHKKCDFLMQNFDARQQALAQEMTALDQSMAMLSGA